MPMSERETNKQQKNKRKEPTYANELMCHQHQQQTTERNPPLAMGSREIDNKQQQQQHQRKEPTSL